ncbi:MAG: hypothetical protein FJ087_05805 [Deltaproteobacteria bacterium]|nr:hypothetical protein [Deltaproteobacteria bacterium]
MRVPLLVLATALAVAGAACGSSDGGCNDDFDCDGTQVCNLSTGDCEPARCGADSDCIDPGRACVDNACLDRVAGGKCRDDADCVKGEGCNLGTLVCVPSA